MQSQPSLVTYNINRGGEITHPPTFAITTRNLITVLPINDALTLPIIGMPEQRQHPKDTRDELGASNNDYENIPLNFAR